jgi:hypothetical protein
VPLPGTGEAYTMISGAAQSVSRALSGQSAAQAH